MLLSRTERGKTPDWGWKSLPAPETQGQAREAEWGANTALPLPITVQEETCLAGLDVPERL